MLLLMCSMVHGRGWACLFVLCISEYVWMCECVCVFVHHCEELLFNLLVLCCVRIVVSLRRASRLNMSTSTPPTFNPPPWHVFSWRHPSVFLCAICFFYLISKHRQKQQQHNTFNALDACDASMPWCTQLTNRSSLSLPLSLPFFLFSTYICSWSHDPNHTFTFLYPHNHKRKHKTHTSHIPSYHLHCPSCFPPFFILPVLLCCMAVSFGALLDLTFSQ